MPCAQNSSNVVTPPSSAYGLMSVQNVPAYSPSAVSGIPCAMFAHATPSRTAGRMLPTTIAHSHAFFQRASSSLCQNSMPTLRTMIAISRTSSAR